MHKTTFGFLIGICLTGLVFVGLVTLPIPQISDLLGWTNRPHGVPLLMAVLWVGWFLALWGALISFMLAVGSWVAGGLEESQKI